MPEDYGYYFWWGDTIGYKLENNAWVASDGSSSGFLFGDANTPTLNKGTSLLRHEGWITAGGVLAPEHDAAHVHWGGKWRMPTEQELNGIASKCDWSPATMNGVAGCIVRGRGDYASSSIFLPCGGEGDGNRLISIGGSYWSSVPSSQTEIISGSYPHLFAHNLRLSSCPTLITCVRAYGLSVRPVQGFTE
jgi:hypothetical protein